MTTAEFIAAEIANLETRREALAKMSADQETRGFVVKCGPLCIAFLPGNAARACGVERATVFREFERAREKASRVTNGAGVRGRAMPLGAAVDEDIASTEAALGALRKAAEAHAN